jgi:hypothetical protein
MNTRTANSVRLLATAGIASMLLAACSGGGGGGSGSSTPSPSVNAQAAALELVKCLRANGQPNFKDPVQDDQGNWTFPDPVTNVPPVCEDVARQSKVGGTGTNPRKVTSEEMTKLRQFAQCMRGKGFSDFPDPLADGTFPALTGQSKTRLEGKDRAADADEEECKKALPAGLNPEYAG